MKSRLLLLIAALVVVWPIIVDNWRLNSGDLAVLHQSYGETRLVSNPLSRRAGSARVALLYLEHADQAAHAGRYRIARSFWHSALTQRYHDTGDFLVRYYAYWLGQRLGIDSHKLLEMGKFRVDSIIEMVRSDAWPPEAASVADVVMDQDWATPRLHVLLVDSYVQAEYYQAALDYLFSVMKRQPAAEWLYFKAGQIQEVRSLAAMDVSLLKGSLGFYKRAYELAPDHLFAVDRLVKANQRLGNFAAAQQWQDALLTQIASRQPEYLMNQQVSNGWVLIGYDLQEELLGLSGTALAPACFWWSKKRSDLTAFEGDSLPNVVLIQCYAVANLVYNGGFELDGRTGTKFPIGFESDWYDIDYDVPFEMHHIGSDLSGERSGNVAWLSNTSDSRYSSFQSDRIGIDPDSAYLAAGNVKPINGHAYLGLLWLKQRTTFGGYDYIGVDSGRSMSWVHLSGLVFPPPDTTGAKVWLLNHDSQEAAYFDDVLFAKVQVPWEAR